MMIRYIQTFAITLARALSRTTAKNIPTATICLFILVPVFLGLLAPALARATPEVRIFYARFDIKINNNTIEHSNLLLVPSDNEFRREKFTALIVGGSADPSADRDAGNMETRARHNAIKSLLEQQGLKSVNSRSGTINGSAESSTVISYEGAIKLPGRIIEKGYNKTSKQFSLTMAVEFAPIAFPDKWEMQRIKFKLKQIADNFFSLFK